MDDHNDEDARTVAEPEMEIDVDEGEGEYQTAKVHSRRPVLIFVSDLYVDQDLAHLRQGLHVPIFSHIETASLIDSSSD